MVLFGILLHRGKDLAFFVNIPGFASMLYKLTDVFDIGKSNGAEWESAVAAKTCHLITALYHEGSILGVFATKSLKVF